jgi:hypothetical protein
MIKKNMMAKGNNFLRSCGSGMSDCIRRRHFDPDASSGIPSAAAASFVKEACLLGAFVVSFCRTWGRADREKILACRDALAGAMNAFEEHSKSSPPAVITE